MPIEETTRSSVVGKPARSAIDSRKTTACSETTMLSAIITQSYQGIRSRGLFLNNGNAIAASTSAKAKWIRRASELVTMVAAQAQVVGRLQADIAVLVPRLQHERNARNDNEAAAQPRSDAPTRPAEDPLRRHASTPGAVGESEKDASADLLPVGLGDEELVHQLMHQE